MAVRTYFLSSLFPEELTSEICKRSKGPIANANNALQWGLYEGLSFFFPSLYLINFPNVGAFPIRYKALEVSGSEIHLNSELIGKSISFINVLYLKHFFKYIKAKKIIENIVESNPNDQHIFFVYDLYPPFLKAIAKCKSKYPTVKIFICLIIPDLHGKTGGGQSMIYKIASHLESNSISKTYPQIDSFVFLSKHMAEIIPVSEKPWVVVEGIFVGDSLKQKTVVKDHSFKTLFYSGAVDKRNGVLKLLEAFDQITDKNYRLFICGDGELGQFVEDQAKKDNRISFFGQIPREKVLELQKQATLLINPREPNQDFTRYSFPSKTMEYFASGTPTLMHVLDGVPKEYYDYCFTIDNNEIKHLKDKIISICNIEERKRIEIGERAKSFILENKLPKNQCELVYKMIVKAGVLNENIN